MPEYDYDLFVIGAGSGGVRAARLTALGGKRVAIAEEFRVGGTCVIRGCVPKKFMVMASDFAHQFKTAEGYGWTVEASFDWPTFLQTKDVEIARLSGIYVANLGKAGVDLIHGRAVLKDAHTVEVTHRDGGEDADRHRRSSVDAGRSAGRRPRHHLARGLPPAGVAKAHSDRGWRLYRG